MAFLCEEIKFNRGPLYYLKIKADKDGKLIELIN